jgi:transcriptional regulator with XRE-family HTH domain
MAIRGLTGLDLAELARVSPATISHALNRHPVTPRTLSRIATALLQVPPVDGAATLLDHPPVCK